MRSRLSQNIEQKNRKRFYISLFGTIILLFLLLRYGIPLLINFTVFLGNIKTNSVSDKQNKNEFVAAPSLDTTFSATNSATVNLTGTAGPKQKISLYVNDSVEDITDTKDDGMFVFR